MCGLTRFLRSAPSNDIIGQVARMTACLVHRVSDDEGVWAEGSIELGPRCLSKLVLTLTHAQNLMFQAGVELECA